MNVLQRLICPVSIGEVRIWIKHHLAPPSRAYVQFCGHTTLTLNDFFRLTDQLLTTRPGCTGRNKEHFHAERLVVYHEDILVQPTQVDVLLSGAIVGVESTMHHWWIQGYEAYDSFQAILQKITVLRQMHQS